jgi:hypothetical protein
MPLAGVILIPATILMIAQGESIAATHPSRKGLLIRIITMHIAYAETGTPILIPFPRAAALVFQVSTRIILSDAYVRTGK